MLTTGLLFKVQPTVTSPEFTASVPPVLIVIFLELLAAEFTVTVCPERILTSPSQLGTELVDQVLGAFQSPDTTELKTGGATFMDMSSKYKFH